MGGAIGAVTRVFDALCASPFATRMGDTHHVATCTRTAVDRYRPDDLARAPGEQTRTLKIEHAARRKWHDQTHRPRRIGLRPRDPRYGRQRGSTRGQMQKLSAGKFHAGPSRDQRVAIEKACRSKRASSFLICTRTLSNASLPLSLVIRSPRRRWRAAWREFSRP